MRNLIAIIALIAFFFPWSAAAQIGGKTTLVADRAIVRDSFRLGNIEVDGIDTSSNWSAADHKKLVTKKAVKDYVEATVGALPAGVQDFYYANDTLYLVTSDSVFLVHIPEPDLSAYAEQAYVDSLHTDLQDSLAVIASRVDTLPTGQGTAGRLPIWLGTRQLGNSPLAHASSRLSLDAANVLGLGGITTAQLPSAAAGDFYYNSSLGRLNWVDGTNTRRGVAWQESTADFAAGRIPFAGSAGGLTSSQNLIYLSATNDIEFTGTNPTMRFGHSGNFTSNPHNVHISAAYSPSTMTAVLAFSTQMNGSGQNPAFISLRSQHTSTAHSFLAGNRTSVTNPSGPFDQSWAGIRLNQAFGLGTIILMDSRYSSSENRRQYGHVVRYEYRKSSPGEGGTVSDAGEKKGYVFSAVSTVSPTSESDLITISRLVGFDAAISFSASSHQINHSIMYYANNPVSTRNADAWGFKSVSRAKNAFRGATTIGDSIAAHRTLDIRGGLRILPDSLQTGSTRLGGYNAAGDATGITPGPGLTLENDTLKVTPSAPEKRFISLWRDLVEHDSLDATPRRLHFPTLVTSEGSWTRTDSTVQLVPGKYLISYTVNFRPIAIGATKIGGHYLYPVLAASILSFMLDQRTFTDDLNAYYTSSYTSFVEVESTVDFSLQHYVAGATIYGDITVLKTLITIEEK